MLCYGAIKVATGSTPGASATFFLAQGMKSQTCSATVGIIWVLTGDQRSSLGAAITQGRGRGAWPMAAHLPKLSRLHRWQGGGKQGGLLLESVRASWVWVRIQGLYQAVFSMCLLMTCFWEHFHVQMAPLWMHPAMLDEHPWAVPQTSHTSWWQCVAHLLPCRPPCLLNPFSSRSSANCFPFLGIYNLKSF